MSTGNQTSYLQSLEQNLYKLDAEIIKLIRIGNLGAASKLKETRADTWEIYMKLKYEKEGLI